MAQAQASPDPHGHIPDFVGAAAAAARLAEAGLIRPTTSIVTTVHQLQIVDERLPHDEHDFTLDYIVTPEEIISCGPAYRPRGLMWPDIRDEQIAAIPVLAEMANER